MHLPKELLAAAQEEDHACSRLVRAVELVAEFSPSLQSHKVYTLPSTAIPCNIHVKIALALVDQVEITVSCCVGFEVFTAVVMKNCIFWDVNLCLTDLHILFI
jgi:hypothetical protein